VKKGKTFLGVGFSVVVLAVLIAGCTEDDDDGEDDITIMVNGQEVSLSDAFGDMNRKSVSTNGQTFDGISLSDLINDTGLASPGNSQFRITASDGWNQDVTWSDMMKGILVEEETMTAFPGLPGKYRIRDVVNIEAVNADTIEVNGHLFVWKQPFHILDETFQMKDQENNTIEGIYLSDVINLTDLQDQASHTYDIQAADGYNKTVTWEDMTRGLLVEEGKKCYLPHLSKKFNVSDIIRIEVI
jgi:hypothetical protein